MPRLRLTAENVNRLPLATSGQVLYLDDSGPNGKPPALEGFGLRVGARRKSYFVEKRVAGRSVRHTIGVHGQVTADQARKLAAVKLGEMTAGADLNAMRRAQREARKKAKAERAEAAQYTVKALCQWYVTHQQARGKPSAADAKSLFAKHVYPRTFASLPARDLTAKQATAIVRSVVEAGHKTSAKKLRAYLRAAYALAQGAETNPQAPAALVLFGVEANPVASTAPIKDATGTRDVTLSEEELGETLRLLRARRVEHYDDALAAVELALLLGGQRPTQVLRLRASEVDLEGRTVALLDPKGRRSTPRRHVLPLADGALDLMKAIMKHRRADWVFGDKSAPTNPNTVARKGVELLAEVQANIAKRYAGRGEPPVRPKIEARDLRRTAETVLAAMGISKDLRAQVLSHGLGGVQDRHYDRHEYLAEKRKVLKAWEAKLQQLVDAKPVPSNVKPLRQAAR